MAESGEMEQSESVSSLRARFEQLSTSPSPTPPPRSPSPRPPTPSAASKPPVSAKPSALQRTGMTGGSTQDEESVTREPGVQDDDGARRDHAEVDSTEAFAQRVDTPERPAKLPLPPRPPSIVVAAASPISSQPSTTTEPPSPATPRVVDAPRTASPDPFHSTLEETTVPPPSPTRPNLTQTPSLRRPAPLPPRPRASSARVSFADDEPPPTAVPTLPNGQPRVFSPPIPSPASSVRSIASRFDELSPASTTPSLASIIVRSPSPLGEDERPDPFSEEGEPSSPSSSEGSYYEADTSPPASTGSSSPEVAAQPKLRPIIPPRPILSSPLPSPQTAGPPPLPSRSSTASSATSTSSVTSGLVPPSRREGPLNPNGAPPALPARRGSSSTPSPLARPTSILLPPRSASPVASGVPAPYIPPPPPTRSAAASGPITPRRPDFAMGDEASSDEDEEDSFLSRSQEFPDATFANRRPPVLRNRRPVHSPHSFSAWAIRGHRVITAHHRIHIWYPSSSSTSDNIMVANDQQKFLAVEFRAADEATPEDDGRFIWCGTKDGYLYEIDTEQRIIVQSRQNMHVSAICGIFRVGRAMVTLDDSGKMLYWGTSTAPDGRERAPDLGSGPHKQQRVPEKQNWAAMIGEELWTSSGPVTKAGAPAVAMRSPQIRVFDPSGKRGAAFSLLPRPLVTPESAGHIGAVTSHAIVPHQEHLVYLGHDNGYVSVWQRDSYACIAVQRISPYSISALCGVRGYLWAGFRTGVLHVLNVEREPWTVKKAWKAHKEPVVSLSVDPACLWKDETLQVASASHSEICLWDGFLREDWLDSELHLRQPDYCTFRTIRSLSISWNIDSNRPSDLHGTTENLEFLQEAIRSVDSPDIISFGFQEAIDLENKKLQAKSMIMGKMKTMEHKLSDSISSAYRQWHDKLVQAVRLAMPADTPYTVVHVGDMIGLFSCIFVKSSELPRLRDTALITVKTGMGGRYGNKGAILSRFVIDDSSICFINVHLAAGQSHTRQRNRDLVDVLEDKANFSELGSSSPGAYTPGGSGSLVFDHELTILSGDLNYRIDARRDFVVSAVASGNCESLLQYDQLLKNLATNQTFRLRSFKEPPIHFPPTYKYDPGTDNYDSSAKKRIPAWCDRVLYRADRADKVTPLQYRRWEVNISDHRPVSAAFDLRIKSVLPEKRAAVWTEVESSWSAVESSLLEEMQAYYVGK
ncbi:hypothetical protein JCM10213_006411 [Rhodosporidiobolus nylandii]